MTQLSYEPAFDPYHAVFRFLRLRELTKKTGPLHQEYLRIFDFYLLFPFRVGEIRLMPKHRKYKKFDQIYSDRKPYSDQPDGRIIFERMRPFQAAAIDTLASKDFIDKDVLARHMFSSTDVNLPPSTNSAVVEANIRDADIFNFFEVLTKDYSLFGDDGLKARTKLLEHRYDAI